MAVARYEINGKFNPSAITQAQINLAKLQKSFSSAALAIKGFAIAKVMQVGAGAINGATAAFHEQEMQLERLNNAVKTNANLTKGSFDRLNAAADKLTSGGASIFSGEEVSKNQAFLASMKLNEQQINNVMKAATNMASAGVMPLDMAVKTLSKTYSGNLGKLKDLEPALSNLTDTQLANGEAVALIAQQYAGFNEALANTEGGKARRFENALDDVRKNLGSIISQVKNISFAHLLPHLEKVNAWLNQNKDKIVNFFRYLPEIVKEAGSLSKNILRKAFSWDFLSNTFRQQMTFCISALSRALQAFATLTRLVADVLWAPLSYAFEVVVYHVKNIFSDVVNFFIDKINFLIEHVNKVAQVFGKSGLNKLESVQTENNAKPENNIGKNIKDAFSKAISEWKDNGKELFTDLVDTWKDIGSEFKGDLNNFAHKFDNILNRAKPGENSSKSGSGESQQQAQAAAQASGQGGEAAAFAGLLDNIKQAGGSIGWLANTAEKAVKTGDPLLALLTVLAELLAIVLDGVISIIGPVLDSILAPLFGMLRIIGKLIGFVLIPYLRLFEPVLRPLIKGFLYLYNNVLVPVGNGIIFVFNIIHNALAGFINGISSLVHKITFGRVDLGSVGYRSLSEGRLERISESELSFEGRKALKLNGKSSSSNAASGASSAVAAKPTVININFAHSFVNGDAREIALMLRREIREAEAMGY